MYNSHISSMSKKINHKLTSFLATFLISLGIRCSLRPVEIFLTYLVYWGRSPTICQTTTEPIFDPEHALDSHAQEPSQYQ